PLNSSTYPTLSSLFFFTVTPPTALSTLSLHDALPIFERHDGAILADDIHRAIGHQRAEREASVRTRRHVRPGQLEPAHVAFIDRSEEHTSELQSRGHLVCRLLLEKKKK